MSDEPIQAASSILTRGEQAINNTLQLILRRPVVAARMPSLALGLLLGLLLGAALLYALPQAFESAADKRGLCATLLVGLLTFFLLEKCATLQRAPRSALATHHASDAILIAAAFSTRPELGVLALLAIGAHARARQLADQPCVLSRHGFYAGKLLCSALAASAGLAAYLALGRGMACMPHVLVLAASGFLYIALSELVPKIQQPASHRDTVVQLLLLGIGVTVVLCFPGPGASEAW